MLSIGALRILNGIIIVVSVLAILAGVGLLGSNSPIGPMFGASAILVGFVMLASAGLITLAIDVRNRVKTIEEMIHNEISRRRYREEE